MLPTTTVSTRRDFYPIAEPSIGALEEHYVLDAVRSGWVSSLGHYIADFENAFAKFCDAPIGVAVSNGTTALHLALATLNIKAGDEVIVPSLTFVATANAVAYTGATPVFVDSESETWCMDPRALARAITPKTKAIIPVHLYGHPCKGRKVGGIGKIGVFSFYGNKLITTGEGGMLVTHDEEIAARARFLRDHAMSKEKRYFHPEVGFNYRMTNIQAALGMAQMQRIEDFIARKRELVQWYGEELSGIAGLEFNPSMPWANSSYWLVCILLPEGSSQAEVAAALRERGMDSRPFFFPVHRFPGFAGKTRAVNAPEGDGCPVADALSARGLNLPSSVTLTHEDVWRIAAGVREALTSARVQTARA
jgi:perosamine synthetase